MIVVFVIDTSPSMGDKIDPNNRSNLSKLDLAKMTVESLTKALDKRIRTAMGRSFPPDQFLLLSTSRQDFDQPGTAACGAGGRLLVGYGDVSSMEPTSSSELSSSWSHNHGEFEHELKRLKAATIPSPPNPDASLPPFPEYAGGAIGLNAALSSGLQLLQRYRLRFRSTENFGLGRLPCASMTAAGVAPQQPQAGGQALQPACLILLTDAECLTSPAGEGGGDLKLQFGNMPLREFYREPFRWDQRVFCIQIGQSASNEMPSSLKALCEVTGGGYLNLKSNQQLSYWTDLLVKTVAPPRPAIVPLGDPLRLPTLPPPAPLPPQLQAQPPPNAFLNGGPVCCFQPLERGPNGEPGPIHRAMLLNMPFQHPSLLTSLESGCDPALVPLVPPDVAECLFVVGAPSPPPLWCIPEAYWPSKKLDTLPPRQAQPLLQYSRAQGYQMLGGSNPMDAMAVIKLLNRYDQLLLLNKAMTQAIPDPKPPQPLVIQARLLQRDVYVCEWLGKGDLKALAQNRDQRVPPSQPGLEHYPVCVPGAGRPGLAEGEGSSFLHIGILNIPYSDSSSKTVSTLTLLPPDAHILLPLLIKAAEAEHRTMRKAIEKSAASGSQVGAQPAAAAAAARNVFLDEPWKTSFRAYLFRIPPYYQAQLRKCLRLVLPATAQALLSNDGMSAIISQCFSRSCLQRIQKGEAAARDINERTERSQEDFRRKGVVPIEHQATETGAPVLPAVVGYGQYDPRASVSTYLNALRTMPPPWKIKGHPDYLALQKLRQSKEEKAQDKDVESIEPKVVKKTRHGLDHMNSAASLEDPQTEEDKNENDEQNLTAPEV